RFWLSWLIAGIIPPCMVATGHLKYYLMLSWPAYVILFLLLIKLLSNLLRCGRTCFFLSMAVLVLVGTGSSAAYVFKNDARGMESNELMVKGGHFVAAVQDALLKTYPRIPSRSVVLFEGFEKKDIPTLWFLSHEDGALHVWYRDFTVEALRLTDLRARDGELHAESLKYTYGTLPKKSRRIDARRAFFIVSLQGRDVVVRRISGADLYRMVLAAGR
ncbi:MAG: hypothetical protein PHR11_07730, partial [Candidatus Omnitrophica bacterium]|nr:hypothetical protein [Candidatus Omnitrophota bacterium]